MKKFSVLFLFVLLSAVYVAQAAAQKESHKDYASMKISECASCHKGEGVAPNHGADWFSEHRILASKSVNNCAQCHAQSYCQDCHFGGGVDANLSTQNYKRDYTPRSHRSDFLSIHPIKAQDNPQTCVRCHDQKSFCNECHSRFPKGSLRIKSHLMAGANNQIIDKNAFREHPTEARRNLQSCQSCHPDGDVCIQCHASGKANPHPRNWNSIKQNYKDRAGSRVCTKCHLPGTY